MGAKFNAVVKVPGRKDYFRPGFDGSFLKYRNISNEGGFKNFLNKNFPAWSYFNKYDSMTKAYIGRTYK